MKGFRTATSLGHFRDRSTMDLPSLVIDSSTSSSTDEVPSRRKARKMFFLLIGIILLVLGLIAFLLFRTSRSDRDSIILPTLPTTSSDDPTGPTGPTEATEGATEGGTEDPATVSPLPVLDIMSFQELQAFYHGKLDPKCGLRDQYWFNRFDKIDEPVGVKPADQPWYLGVFWHAPYGPTLLCGALLVSSKWIFTDFNCVLKLKNDANRVSWAVGGHVSAWNGQNFISKEPKRYNQFRQINTAKVHLDVTSLVALIKLLTGFALPVNGPNGTIVINTVCLPPHTLLSGYRPDVPALNDFYEMVGTGIHIMDVSGFLAQFWLSKNEVTCPDQSRSDSSILSLCGKAVEPICPNNHLWSPLVSMYPLFPVRGLKRTYLDGLYQTIICRKDSDNEVFFSNITYHAFWIQDVWSRDSD